MSDSLTAEQALEFVEDLLVRQSGRRLSEDEKAIFRGSWEDLTYDDIMARSSVYCHDVDFRKVGSGLWKTIADLFELPRKKVTKKTFPGLVEQQWKLRQQTPPPWIESPEPESSQPDGLASDGFVGREQAVRELDELRAAGATCILIQSPGGVGKTVLAERYLSQRFDRPVLRFDLGKETQNISSAEGLIEQKLRDLGEEPGREFMVSCDRLRSKLKTEALPVLVDNLEPALDESGRLIETHRSYVELFRVLSDSSSKSLTLITSRERVRENLNISLYPLKHLSLEAWQEYFNQTNLQSETPVLAEIHQAYRGNALAMKVLRERISLDYGGQIEEYWKAHQTEDGVSVETDIENLISGQFERLATLHPIAYRLLCRMGCFRYQDVPTVPREGLLCLLWDLPAKGKVRVIEALCDRALVERVDGEYKLHPLIRDEAVERLRSSDDWEISNRTAAEFWTNSVETVETVEDAVIAHEAYFHYSAIGNFDACCQVIVKIREGEGWNKLETLGRAYYRLGLADRMIISILFLSEKVNFKTMFCGADIYSVIGSMYWVKGEINMAIKYYDEVQKIATKHKNHDMLANSLLNLGLCKLDIEELACSLELFKNYAKVAKEYNLSDHLPISYFCLAFLNAKLGYKNAAKKLLSKFESADVFKKKSTPWDKGYSFLFCGDTLKLIGLSEKSLEFYEKALEFSSHEYYYPQVQALALMGMAEFYRITNHFGKSIDFHNQSVNTLKKIDSKCKLAEAYYQLALTYQAMNDRPNSQVYFQKALTLWEKIEAPKQIERVHQAMELGSV